MAARFRRNRMINEREADPLLKCFMKFCGLRKMEIRLTRKGSAKPWKIDVNSRGRVRRTELSVPLTMEEPDLGRWDYVEEFLDRSQLLKDLKKRGQLLKFEALERAHTRRVRKAQEKKEREQMLKKRAERRALRQERQRRQMLREQLKHMARPCPVDEQGEQSAEP